MKNHLPIVTEKRKRGRELKSFVIPGQEEAFYRGSDGGRQLLVPKSNLEAMKELVNLKMRRRENSLFTRTPDILSEKRELQRYLGKLEHLREKLSDFNDEGYNDSRTGTFSSLDDSLLIHIPTRAKSIPKNTKVSLDEKNISIKTSIKYQRTSLSEDRNHKNINGNKLTEKHLERKVSNPTLENEIKLSSTNETRLFDGQAKYLASKTSPTKDIGTDTTKSRRTIEGTSPIRSLFKKRAKSAHEKNSSVKSLKSEPESRKSKLSEIEPVKIKSLDKSTRANTVVRASAVEEIYETEISFTEERVKFLITGHFRSDKRPFFIIQPYSGKSPLCDKKSKLSSNNLKNDVNILICGRYFNDDILMEVDNVPKALKIGKTFIPIDDETIIFEEGSYEDLSTPLVDIKVGGKFIKHSTFPHFTPSILIRAEKFHLSHPLKQKKKLKSQSKTRSPVLNKTPSKKGKKERHVSRYDDYMNQPKTVTYAIESRGNDFFSFHNEGGEIVYEYIPDKKSKTASPALNPTGTKNKLYYGDDSMDRDNHITENNLSSIPLSLYKQEIIYECGKDVKADNAKQHYSAYQNKNTERRIPCNKSKPRKVGILTKINEKLFSKEK